MSTDRPIPCQWDGEAFLPLRGFGKVCDQHFVVGEVYRLVTQEDRSAKSHAHFFASVTEAWQNLPERYSGRFPSPDHLRKWALIKAGFRDERTIVCSSRAEAQRLAAFIKPMDEFAVVVVQGTQVTVFTARSQNMRAMGKQDFQASKDAVLDVLAAMIGTSSEALARADAA